MGACQCKHGVDEPNEVYVHKKTNEDKNKNQNDKKIVLFQNENRKERQKVSANRDQINQNDKLPLAQELKNHRQNGIFENEKIKEIPVIQKEVQENKEKESQRPVSGKSGKEESRTMNQANIQGNNKGGGGTKSRISSAVQKDRNYDRERGDESFGYEYDNDEYGNEGGEDEEEIEIENTYFEADDKKNSNPKDAIEGFQSVIMLEENRSEKKYTFQSLLNIILIKCKLQLYDDLSGDVTRILRAMDKVSKNDANDAINSILESLLNLEDQTQSDKAIMKILDYLKEKNYEQLWLNASIRLCKIYFDRKEFGQFETLVESIKETCRLPDGSDDLKKSSVLLEVYSLEINMHMQTMNIAKIKEIYNKTKNISSAIADPRTMGIIKDTHGRMLMIEKDWEAARLELFEAFKYYQEVGSGRAKSVLKYVVLVSILSQSSLSPFDNVEAKVYREDPDIKIIDNLRTAYEQKNGKELVKLMSNFKHKIFDEAFIQQFEEDFMNVICLEMIVALSGPYKRMTFDYLQRELTLTAKQVEVYLNRLILSGKLVGRINLVEGFFENDEVKRNRVEEKKNQALHQWIKALSGVNNYY